jgi:2-oxoglutarate dehydrogenase E2 component (dihydrolipoamide succinyltransferase)
MGKVQMVMPKMGESVMEGTILRWLKQVGDSIEQDEPVLEVATDKVDTEIPATEAGILSEILVPEGQTVQVGQVIAIISTESEAISLPNPVLEVPTHQSAAVPVLEKNLAQVSSFTNGSNTTIQSNRFYSPLVLNIARQEGIDMQELESLTGTGADARVTKKDILQYLTNRTKAISTPNTTQEVKQIPLPTVQKAPESIQTVSVNGNVEILEMDRMRKMIAQRMLESKKTSAHVTTFVEADLTNLVNWRNRIKNEFLKKHGENITFTPIFIEAIAKAIKDFPMINCSVNGEQIVLKKDINIGMATAVANFNLIVPVIHHADQYNLVGLTKKVNDLAKRARENKLSPDELSGGTYTLSNIGSFGNEAGTPIIMQPQVAIMAFGTIKKKPAVIETSEGDFIGIRQLMFLSHSYDHRVVDGALGGSFVRKVADYLEKFDTNRDI